MTRVEKFKEILEKKISSNSMTLVKLTQEQDILEQECNDSNITRKAWVLKHSKLERLKKSKEEYEKKFLPFRRVLQWCESFGGANGDLKLVEQSILKHLDFDADGIKSNKNVYNRLWQECYKPDVLQATWKSNQSTMKGIESMNKDLEFEILLIRQEVLPIISNLLKLLDEDFA